VLSKDRVPTYHSLERFAGEFSYVLSLFVLKEHKWKGNELRHALKLVSCPRVLLPNDQNESDYAVAHSRELEMLRVGFDHPDSREFGVFGTCFGYASWAGVSYHGFGGTPSAFVDIIADFEIAVQSLWLFCYWVNKVATESEDGDNAALQKAAAAIRNDIGRLKAIGPTDPTEVRMMCEAILITSRIQAHVNATLEAIEMHRRKRL
jgi:hypothetical protein